MCVPAPGWPRPLYTCCLPALVRARPSLTERELSWGQQPAPARSLTASADTRETETPLPGPGNPDRGAEHTALDNCYQTGITTSNYVPSCCLQCPDPSSPVPDGRNTSRVNRKQNNKAGLRLFIRGFCLPQPGRVFVCRLLCDTDVTLQLSGSPQNNLRGPKMFSKLISSHHWVITDHPDAEPGSGRVRHQAMNLKKRRVTGAWPGPVLATPVTGKAVIDWRKEKSHCLLYLVLTEPAIMSSVYTQI